MCLSFAFLDFGCPSADLSDSDHLMSSIFIMMSWSLVFSNDACMVCCCSEFNPSSTTLNKLKGSDSDGCCCELVAWVTCADESVGNISCCRISTGRSDFAMTQMVSALSLNICLIISKAVSGGNEVDSLFSFSASFLLHW